MQNNLVLRVSHLRDPGNEVVWRTHFHMKGFALRLVLKQRHKKTCLWMKSHFHMKGSGTPRLALWKRLKKIRKWLNCERLDDTTALQLNRGSIPSSPYNSKLLRKKSSKQLKASSLQFVFYTGPDVNTKMSAPCILYVSNKSICSSFRSSPRHKGKGNILSLLWRLSLLNQRIPPVIAEETTLAEYFVFYNWKK